MGTQPNSQNSPQPELKRPNIPQECIGLPASVSSDCRVWPSLCRGPWGSTDSKRVRWNWLLIKRIAYPFKPVPNIAIPHRGTIRQDKQFLSCWLGSDHQVSPEVQDRLGSLFVLVILLWLDCCQIFLTLCRWSPGFYQLGNFPLVVYVLPWS